MKKLLIILLLLPVLSFGQIWKDVNVGFPARTFCPPVQCKIPAMIYFHGRGERGSNLNTLCISQHPSPLWYAKYDTLGVKIDYYVFAPQLPLSFSSWPSDSIPKIINYVKSLPFVDSTQIWVAGHSLGGGAVYSVITNPKMSKDIAGFVLIAPVFCSTSKASIIAQAGIRGRAYHAMSDPITSGPATKALVDAVNAINPGQMQGFFYYNNTAHAIVPKAFKDLTLNPWLKQQYRR